MSQNELEAYVEMRLQKWGDWFVRFDFGLGFPKKSIEARMMEYGCITGVGQKIAPSNFEAEQIENFVRELFEVKPKCAEALRATYFNQELQQITIAQRHISPPISLRRLEERLCQGRFWILAKLSEEKIVYKKVA